jgi:hypothetical protein
MTEDNGAKTEGAKVPREELCPTCGRTWGDLTGCYCSNSWHLAAPMVRKQIASLQDELTAAKESIEHLKALIYNKNALIETYERQLESNSESKA